MCFGGVPEDVSRRDVVLAALWHLTVKAAQLGLPVDGRTFRHTLVGQRAGIRSAEYREALKELLDDGLITQARNGYGLTRRGFAAVREIVDVDHTIAIARTQAE